MPANAANPVEQKSVHENTEDRLVVYRPLKTPVLSVAPSIHLQNHNAVKPLSSQHILQLLQQSQKENHQMVVRSSHPQVTDNMKAEIKSSPAQPPSVAEHKVGNDEDMTFDRGLVEALHKHRFWSYWQLPPERLARAEAMEEFFGNSGKRLLDICAAFNATIIKYNHTSRDEKLPLFRLIDTLNNPNAIKDLNTLIRNIKLRIHPDKVQGDDAKEAATKTINDFNEVSAKLRAAIAERASFSKEKCQLIRVLHAFDEVLVKLQTRLQQCRNAVFKAELNKYFSDPNFIQELREEYLTIDKTTKSERFTFYYQWLICFEEEKYTGAEWVDLFSLLTEGKPRWWFSHDASLWERLNQLKEFLAEPALQTHYEDPQVTRPDFAKREDFLAWPYFTLAQKFLLYKYYHRVPGAEEKRTNLNTWPRHFETMRFEMLREYLIKYQQEWQNDSLALSAKENIEVIVDDFFGSKSYPAIVAEKVITPILVKRQELQSKRNVLAAIVKDSQEDRLPQPAKKVKDYQERIAKIDKKIAVLDQARTEVMAEVKATADENLGWSYLSRLFVRENTLWVPEVRQKIKERPNHLYFKIQNILEKYANHGDANAMLEKPLGNFFRKLAGGLVAILSAAFILPLFFKSVRSKIDRTFFSSATAAVLKKGIIDGNLTSDEIRKDPVPRVYAI